MSLAILFQYLMLNMFRMLIHPSSGACDLFVELFHGLYCSGTMRVGVMLWFGWVVWYPDAGWSLNQSNTTHEITQQISRKLLRMDVLTSETCWALNNEIKNKWHQVGLFLFNYMFVALVIKHANGTRRILLSFVGCLVLPYFSTISHKRHHFRK